MYTLEHALEKEYDKRTAVSKAKLGRVEHNIVHGTEAIKNGSNNFRNSVVQAHGIDGYVDQFIPGTPEHT